MRRVLRTGILPLLGLLALDISSLREYVQHGSDHYITHLLDICLIKVVCKSRSQM